MANNYEKETRTIIHNLEHKQNLTEKEIEVLQSYYTLKESNQKMENIYTGAIILVGVFVINFILPHFRFFSLNIRFSPNIGPFDWLLIISAIRFIWKGIV